MALGAGGDDLEAEAAGVVAGDQPGVVGRDGAGDADELVAVAGDRGDIEGALPGARV